MRRYETTHLFHTSYGIFLSSLSAFVDDYSTSRGSLVVKKFWIFVDLTLSSSALIICPHTGQSKKTQSYLLIELNPMESFASLEPRIEISACNFTNQTLLANPDSSWLTRYSRWCICRFRSQFSRYFSCMVERWNFGVGSSLPWDVFGGNSSSDGVNI